MSDFDLESDSEAFADPLSDVQQSSKWANKRCLAIALTIGGIFLLCSLLVLALAFQQHSVAGNTNVGPQVWEHIRLPPWQRPVNYKLRLQVDPRSGRVSGSLDLQLKLLESSSFLVVHSNDLVLDASKTTLQWGVGEPVAALPSKRNDELQQDVIPFARVLPASDELVYVLHLEWTNALDTTMVGFYQSSYEEAGSRHFLASTHFEATDARRAFPCLDEPQMKAHFELTLEAPAIYTTRLFNMPAKPTSTPTVTVFERTPLMSTYLVCFVVSTFQSVSATTVPQGLPVKTWARPDALAAGQYAADVSALMLRSYGSYFGIQFPLPKMDQVAVPDFNAGAMENWGLITYRETALLYDPKHSSTSDKERVAAVCAHELAHQWFGDLVTMRWWNDVFLNEGFATFVEYIGMDMVHPEWNVFDSFVLNDQQRALYSDSLSSTHPVSHEASTPAEIGALFGPIIYSKGGSLLRMLRDYLDHVRPDSFRIGLQDYLRAFRDGNAASEDLWEALSATSGVDVFTMMNRWTKRPGYPVISFSTGECGALTMHQERFLQKATPDPELTTWRVPIRYLSVDAGGSVDQQQILLPDSEGEESPCVPQDATLLIMNVNRTGFYRVHYTDAQVQALIDDIKSDAPFSSAADCSGLLDDLYSLSKSDHKDFGVNVARIMDVAEAVLKSPHARFQQHALFKSVLSTLAAMRGKISPDLQLQLKTYTSERMQPRLLSLGWSVGTAEADHDENLLRALLLETAVDLDDAQVQQEALRRFENFSDAVHPDLRSALYRASVRTTTGATLDKNFEWLLARYRSPTTAAADAKRALSALAHATEQAKLETLLAHSIDASVVRPQDTSGVIQNVARQRPDVAWDFVKANYEKLRENFAHHLFTFSSLLNGVCSGLNTQASLDDVTAFLTSQSADANVIKAVQDAIHANIYWGSKYSSQLEAWLSSH